MKENLKGLCLPLLVAAYPVLFLYGNNAANLQLGNLLMPLGFSLLAAGLAYALFYLFQRKVASASLSAAAFLFFYYLYGTFFNLLIHPDRFPVYHFILLPVVIALAAYAGYFIAMLKPSLADLVQKILLFFALFLVTYNLVIILPVEVQKAAPKLDPKTASAATIVNNNQKYPDIYYIIFDEYERFDVMRTYFHDYDVDQFAAFLKQNGFFVVTNSRTVTINTQTEMSSRLNLQQYTEKSDVKVTLAAINDNKVMRVVKSYGYTTASLDMAFPKITADYRIKYDPNVVAGMASDEFRQAFLDNTMFKAFLGYFQDTDLTEIKQRDLILYTLDQTANLTSLPSPKFVYTHVLLPHMPFIFDKDGNLLPIQDNYDWHYYMGQHQYATKLAEDLITRLLAQADPRNPPVIIVQSDHGARNMIHKSKDNILMDGYLEKYPIDYAYDNFNAMYLPGIDPATLSDKMPPINTMVLVLNHYLKAGVAITPAGK